MAYRIEHTINAADAPVIVIDVYQIIDDDTPEHFICTKEVLPYTPTLWDAIVKHYGEGKTVENYPDDNPTVVWVY